MDTLTIANKTELDAALDKDGNLKFDGKIEFEIDIPAGWIKGLIAAREIAARDIHAGDIHARDIHAGNIHAWDIDAWDIHARACQGYRCHLGV